MSPRHDLLSSLRPAACLLALVLVTACGDDGDGADTGAQPDTEVVNDVTVADSSDALDTTVTPDGTDATTPETTSDTRPEASELSDFRESCGSNGDCRSGWCVPSADGNVCTHGCSEGCPAGWGCGRVLNVTIDQIELCLDRATTLCHPCSDDDDCNLFGGGNLNHCLDLQDGSGNLAGRFCGISCNDNDRCPDGFSCLDATGAATTGEGQCRPDAQVCSCNELAQALQLATACNTSNVSGTCAGTRACGAEGLTSCDARVAETELCNALDDDCDGLTDEEVDAGAACDLTNEFGVCPGKSYCIGGQPECLGVEAVVEICDGNDQDCDGQTDEGFSDFDTDSLADCQDPDDDDDGTPDGEDCDPLNDARSKGATELCGNDLDDDCDGSKEEEGASGCETFFQDVDGDSFGSAIAPGRCLCSANPSIFYVVANTDDCNDLEASIKPGATEVCNHLDDSCEGNTDEGVSAPCGGCVNICLLEAGPGGSSAFNLGNATNLALDGQGNLRLAAGETSGTYRHQWVGWPLDGTDWDILFLDATFPSDATSVSLRWRTAATQAGLAGVSFVPLVGPFPPETFPLYIETLGNFVEVELRLDTTNVAETPLIHGISILAAAD